MHCNDATEREFRRQVERYRDALTVLAAEVAAELDRLGGGFLPRMSPSGEPLVTRTTRKADAAAAAIVALCETVTDPDQGDRFEAIIRGGV
jgi:hypothetical protein